MKARNVKIVDVITAVLLVIGGINWGCVGFFNFNFISAIFGEASAWSNTIYALVGLSALYDVLSFVFGYKAMQTRWCETSMAVKH